MKLSFNSHANKTNFYMKSFSLNLTFIMSFTVTHDQKWSVQKGCVNFFLILAFVMRFTATRKGPIMLDVADFAFNCKNNVKTM